MWNACVENQTGEKIYAMGKEENCFWEMSENFHIPIIRVQYRRQSILEYLLFFDYLRIFRRIVTTKHLLDQSLKGMHLMWERVIGGVWYLPYPRGFRSAIPPDMVPPFKWCSEPVSSGNIDME